MIALIRQRTSETVPLFLLLFCALEYVDAGSNVVTSGIPGVEILMPSSHVALSGDLRVEVISTSFPPLLLQLSRVEGRVAQPLTTLPVLPEARALARNRTIVLVPCGYFSRGGLHYVRIWKQGFKGNASEIVTRSLDVRWPMPQLSLVPERIQTYPESPVIALLEFPGVCPPVADSPASAIPEFWLELRYCGHSILTCDNGQVDGNRTVQTLYFDQIRAFPGKKNVTLRCELFGLAGHYALTLRPTTHNPNMPHIKAYVKADWSEQFVFNVHTHSIFPCDVHSPGVTVLFQYPACILASGDRVRLYARLRANVASLAPPTTLVYVAEQRVARGQHSLTFSCELFSEHYYEYCFIYVSQAITGAVEDVREDCVPTLPVTDSESGGWGPWSPWTKCSSTCLGGTRSRYRLCDSPPPRYGAKFCEGSAVETEKCGLGLGGGWECLSGGGVGELAAEMPEVQAEVGPYCRCGCVVHLGQAKPKRLLAASSQSCPGRTFWLIQADDDHTVEFRVDQFYLPCGKQRLKVRDGNSLSATLLADLSGIPGDAPSVVQSSGCNLLLEFVSDESLDGGQVCGGGFLAHASQTRSPRNVTGIPVAQGVSVGLGAIPAAVLKLTAVHIAAIFFLSGLLIASALLGAQYVFRYRKYHRALADDQDSLASLADPTASCGSIPLRTRASSSATLLSEVISLTRLRPHVKTKYKHSRLRESIDSEQEEPQEQEATLAKEEESISAGSTATLTQQEPTPPMLDSSATQNVPSSLPCSPHDLAGTSRKSSSDDQHGTLKRSSSMREEKGQPRETEEKKSTATVRRTNNASAANLTNVRASPEICSLSDPGCYSPAASTISTATIRSTNAKETKEKRNREKLLLGPGQVGSDFSIVGPDVDLEFDYYDYNVVNAGAAPGSYLGMDPAFLVWIPPLDESGEILDSHEMQDIRPKVYIDPGSNTESPEEEMLLPKRQTGTPKGSPVLKLRGGKSCKRLHPLIISAGSSIESVKGERDGLLGSKGVCIQMQELGENRKSRESEVMEKETKVEKSPSVGSNVSDDIKFVDDDEDEKDLCEIECNMSYHDSNILSSK